jgi:CHAD domain-containing protein
MTHQVEVERKYALAAGQQLPPLDDLVTPGTVEEFDLVATYYDSPDFRLGRARQVIRRRVGGHDEGWHLKAPGTGPDERLEVQVPLGHGSAVEVPPQLRARVATYLDGAPLVPVAVLRTHRREQELLGADGAVVAHTCTDDVRAEVGERRDQWREAEVELAGGGDVALLDAIEARLTAAGIHRAAVGSKVARALGTPPALRQLGATSSAGEVLLAYLATQVGVLQGFPERYGSDKDATHDARVATRRLRAALLVYGAVLEDAGVRAVATPLRRFTRALGETRDYEVAIELLMEPALDIVARDGDVKPLTLVVDSLEALMNELAEDRRDVPGGPLSEELQQALMDLLAAPRLTALAAEPAIEVLPALRAGAVHELATAGEWALTHFSLLTTWHSRRKEAKVVRYATEVLLPVVPGLVGQRAAWERVTETLGSLQDVVMAHHKLEELALAEVAEGEPPGTFDELRRGLEDRLPELLAQGKAALAEALGGE